jgi:hypothetical protein
MVKDWFSVEQGMSPVMNLPGLHGHKDWTSLPPAWNLQ